MCTPGVRGIMLQSSFDCSNADAVDSLNNAIEYYRDRIADGNVLQYQSADIAWEINWPHAGVLCSPGHNPWEQERVSRYYDC